MGNIYTKDIKRIVRELYNKYKDEIKDDFSSNKQLVIRYVDVKSKKVRNRLAGYLTRYYKIMKEKETLPMAEEKLEETEEV
ncbi:30S ribosomal protein S17e [Sulfolobus sp. A20]|uniref:30S ribosomal protein S17e n=1 Tax=Sulfolobaceae TaxID=118883 RepID=UPI000845FA2C|nr:MULTISPECIES: 30S ribosomal protein S17e [unclassified Sulfolobus]TRM77067.1 30S ribosomal protein S17e [Sulfolobus sp. B5]TRM77783.1 30S ribosomal protein S17e [Sulfolobus sp. A20-N-F8]TRM80940.1 30S ribosomal protein S17e [Sulfolobus sp. D5]TRM83907.1 30S ribosomal protein S17e [Sulfolobus sp. A20-N-F6]TRM86826.1 30S ribosomal protein S17e [Sulfolobus sp. E3]TRM88703.1 30S ribosomal protein S17e [Sulfolobus sp. C3]TRM94750.1 30S ribosomal protein S17e [Sulfolobus sp. A20-N-G8]TRN00088.